jgi:thymidylate synthase
MKNFDQEWLHLLDRILCDGQNTTPRGLTTKELLHQTIVVDMRRPVLVIPERKLSYQFMAAEAYWILSGDNRVETIAPFNKRIAEFSDDGRTFYGAYGPRIHDQLDYVINTLLENRDTRQAAMTIWRENPPKTKDVPCTIGLVFNIRDGVLHTSVLMRSSDVWLGIPYDVFNFSMLSHYICATLNYVNCGKTNYNPGLLYLTAVSSHLYKENWEQAKACICSEYKYNQLYTPIEFFQSPTILITALERLRTSSTTSTLRWWYYETK